MTLSYVLVLASGGPNSHGIAHKNKKELTAAVFSTYKIEIELLYFSNPFSIGDIFESLDNSERGSKLLMECEIK